MDIPGKIYVGIAALLILAGAFGLISRDCFVTCIVVSLWGSVLLHAIGAKNANI